MANGKLKKVAVSGGPPEVICDAPSGSDGTWSKEGVILFDGADVDPIKRVNAAGGIAAPAIPADSANQVGWPAFLPDGKHYLYTLIASTGGQEMVGTLGEPKGKPLGMRGSRIAYSPDGYLLFARDRTLLAQKFDAGARKLQGEPFPVAEDLPVGGNAVANFSVSNNGVLVYRATGAISSRLMYTDRTGRELQEVASPADLRAPALSPDGTRIAYRRREADGTNLDVWVTEPARGTTTRFTFDPADDSNPVWSPDGSQIAWLSNRGGGEGIWVKASNGVGAEQLVCKAATNGAVLQWTRDGKYIVYQNVDPKNGMDLGMVAVTGDRKPQVLLATPFDEQRAEVSPDSRWLAYESNESGRAEVYVVSFQGNAGKWQISTHGGIEPHWSHDGRELYYLSSDQKLMSVPVPSAATFSPGTPQSLFRIATEASRRRNAICVTPDNQKFLCMVPVGENSTPMTVMVHWRAGQTRK
jgi:Tol biopolymer transport system component